MTGASRGWQPSILILSAVLAGCVEPPAAPPEPPLGPHAPTPEDGAAAAPFSLFLCNDGYRLAVDVPEGLDRCNHRATKPLLDPTELDVVTQHGPGNEVSIAVDPRNPLVVAGGAKDYTVSYVSDVAGCGEYTVWMGTYWSADGGLSWGNDLMPGFPGDTRDSPLRGNRCNTDPVLAFDDDGTLWYSGLNYAGTREDSAGAGLPSPLGGSDPLTGSQIYFARSGDGGATFPDISFASAGEGELLFNDKQWFAVQPDGDHMIVTWSQFVSTPGTLPAAGGAGNDRITYTESLDSGATWLPEKQFAVGEGLPVSSQFSMPQYLPLGEVADLAVIWADFSTSDVRGGAGVTGTARLAYVEGVVTPSGTAFGAPRAAFGMNPLKSGESRDGTGPSAFRISTYPVLAVDTSGGEHDGRRYVVWADQMGELDTDTQVLLRWSDDGMAWSETVPVNDAAAGDQFMPWIDVDPAGGVHVAWYDRRNDPDNRLLDVYYAYSDTGGQGFHPNLRVTERSFDGDLGHHQSGAAFIGDYIGVDATPVSAHIIWADTRHTGMPGREAGSDVYTATIVTGLEAREVFDAAFAS